MLLVGLGILIVVGTISFIVAVCRTPSSDKGQNTWQPSQPPRDDFEKELDRDEMDWELDDLEDDLRGR